MDARPDLPPAHEPPVGSEAEQPAPLHSTMQPLIQPLTRRSYAGVISALVLMMVIIGLLSA